jgi:hypothetical protein
MIKYLVLLCLCLIPFYVFAQEEDIEAPPSSKVLCIGQDTVNSNQSLGDVVAVYPGNHVFSPDEQNKFIIIHIPNVSPNQILEAIAFVASVPGQEKKYLVSIANLTLADIEFLEDPNESIESKIQLLRSKLKDNTK